MSARKGLCLDIHSCTSPELVGLDGERLDAQGWLAVFCTGEEARVGMAAADQIDEVWVVSSDDVDAINLAATLKADRPEVRICLVGDGDGSMRSRAYTASIDQVMDIAEFASAYEDAKRQLVVRPQVVPEALPQVKRTVTRSKGFLLPVLSGSGGAGKSTISTLASLLAQRAGYRTLLLDYDLQFGDVAANLGVSGAPAIDEIAAHPELVEGLSPQGSLPAIVSAPSRIEAAESFGARLPELLDLFVQHFDVVVANTGAAWAEHHAVLLERSSAALFLVDQRSSSLRACKHALELCNRCGIATGPFRFALNRCSKNALFTAIDVSCALKGTPVFELRDGGPTVEEYLAAGVALQLVEESNDLSISLAALLARLLPQGSRRLGPQAEEGGSRRSGKRRMRSFLKGGDRS